MPKISVIMSVYNGEKFLEEAVLSVLNQTYKDFEFIIIDDGSTDSSLEMLGGFEKKDERIRLVSRKNKGLTPSLNEGIKLAQGEYIARMDGDDISMPERFEKQLDFLEKNKEIALCGTWAINIDENGNEIGEYKTPTTHKEIKKMILFHNPFIHPSVMIRKSVFEKVGLYSEHFKHIEDYELWTRVLAHFKTANIQEFLLKYRITGNGVTRKNRKIMLLKGVMVRILYLIRKITK